MSLVSSYEHILALDFDNKTSYSVISNLTRAAALDFSLQPELFAAFDLKSMGLLSEMIVFVQKQQF